ncbi:HAD family hydrolase [Paenibacillus agricola]|uniref:HAD family hydrolase n=1 Tax=Paenibacillus agricola TaxID=2716264 RepID=A0ABX0J9B1_9BACL|nr:HAD family hydrolase [Paenibacillus agricola]NHN31393.1 HAD family hydrolase [Paenibacillus agricola]
MGKPYPIQGKKAICFDLNETLIHQGITFEHAFRSVWNDYAGRGLQGSDSNADTIWEQYQEQWQQHRKSKSSELSFDLLQEQCLKDAIAMQQLPVHQGFAPHFFQLVRKQRLAGKTLAPGVETTLRALSQNYRLAIISNSPHSEVDILLERFRLKSYFSEERIFTAHKPSEKKPGFLIFKTALQALDLMPRQAVMVGNSWKHDICGAAKAGLDVIWLRSLQDRGTKKISRQKLGKRTVYHIQEISQLLELFH